MFEKLFSYIRSSVKTAILGGIADAQEELETRIENREPLRIESPEETNGRQARRKAKK